MENDYRTVPKADSSLHMVRAITTVLAWFAVAAPASVLIGWTFDIPTLRGFGNPSYSVGPFITTIFLGLAVSLVLARARHHDLALVVLTFPALCLVLVGLQVLVGAQLGLERWLFPDQIEPRGVINDGVPGLGGSAILAVNCTAIFLITRQSVACQSWAVLLASAAFALTLLTFTVTLIDDPENISVAFIGRSSATSMPALALAAAAALHVIAQIGEHNRPFLLGLLQKLFPAIVILPVFPSLITLIGMRSGSLSLNEAQFVVVFGNIIIVAVVLFYGMRQLMLQTNEILYRERQLRATLRGIPDAVIITDADGTVLDFSPSAERHWGYPASQVIGKSASELLHSSTTGRLSALLAREDDIPRSGEAKMCFEGFGKKMNGTVFPIEMRASCFQSSAGRNRLALFARDMTDKIAEDKKLAELSAQLAYASRHNAMGELAADLAHELNQPLTAALNYLSALEYLLKQSNGPPNAPEVVSSAKVQMQRAGEIIRRMRDFVSSREVEKRNQPVAPLIEEALQMIRSSIASRNVQVAVDVEAAITVFVDRIQVQQVIVNLLRNAAEAIADTGRLDGWIVISATQRNPDWIEVQISDNGPGLPRSVLDQLFERFTSTKAGAGMGIGLSISRRIIDAHGGEMIACNSPEGGANFRFTLPAAAGEDDS